MVIYSSLLFQRIMPSLDLACRTDVIFCVFQASEGKRETSETRATGRLKNAQK